MRKNVEAELKRKVEEEEEERKALEEVYNYITENPDHDPYLQLKPSDAPTLKDLEMEKEQDKETTIPESSTQSSPPPTKTHTTSI